MHGGKSVPWMAENGGYSEKHPLWKEAYRHEILRQSGYKKKDELGGYENLDELVRRYQEEATPSLAKSMDDFVRWNMEQVYKRNRILNQKQKLRKKLTDMKRERPDRYNEYVKQIIINYSKEENQPVCQSDDDDCSEEEIRPTIRIDPTEMEVNPRTGTVGFKSPRKSPMKSPSKSPSKSPLEPPTSSNPLKTN